MKSIKFLAALAVPAMFAACTNEDLADVQQSVAQQDKEFVGAELIAKGLSINLGSTPESRMSSDGWSSTDKLGLGWVVADDYHVTQSEAIEPTVNNLFANHLFYNVGGNKFETKANIYAGWHFAYFPFTYMEKLGEEKTITVNPPQTEDWTSDRYNTCFQVSARAFLSKDNLDEDYQLNDKVTFAPARAFNTIGINIQPSETFTKNEILKDLKVKSLNLNVGAGVFAKQVVLHPQNLAKVQYENNVYSEELTKTELRKSFVDAFKMPLNNNGAAVSKRSNVTTEIDNAAINLTGDQWLRIYTLAQEAAIKPEKVVFTINVEGGVFTVNYVDEESDKYDAAAKVNNETIEKLVAAYAKDGAMTTFGNVLYKDMNLQLEAHMFEPATDAIDSEEAWNHAVDVVTALGMKNVEFTIIEGEDGPWAFEDVDKDGNLINLPEIEGANVTVKGENMILAAAGIWPSEGLTVETGVVVNDNLAVEDGTEMVAAAGIVNNATITAGYLSHIVDVDNNKEIKVVYGSYVTIKNGADKGVISYEVPAAGDASTVDGQPLTTLGIQTQIEYLIAESGNTQEMPYANVNKLVVNNGVELELTYNATSTGGSGAVVDPYRPAGPKDPTITGAHVIPGLEKVSFEINGGKVTSSLPATAKNAVINGGSLVNVNVTNGLNATDATVAVGTITGNVVAENTAITAETITGNVTLKGESVINNAVITNDVTAEDGTTNMTNVNINGTLTTMSGSSVVISGNDTMISNIENYGNLTTNVNIFTTTVEIFNGSKATVASGKTIWYTEATQGEYGYTQEGTTQGRILYMGLTYATTTKDVQDALNSGEDVILLDDIKIEKTEAESNGYGKTGISILNGQTLDGNGNSISVDAWTTWDSAINTTGGLIKNINVTGGMRGIFVNHNSTHNEKVVLENVVIDGTVYTISCDQGTNQGLEATNCTFNGWTSYAKTIGNVSFTNCSFGLGQGYKYCRPYAPTKFVNCDFCEGFIIDAQASVSFENCRINGIKLTNENIGSLVSNTSTTNVEYVK